MADFRGNSRDFKRDADNRHKWERGIAWGPGRQETAHPRPSKKKLYGNSQNFYPPGPNPKLVRENNIRRDYAEVTDSSASSAEEDNELQCMVSEAKALNQGDNSDIAFSYDAATGPSTGSKILGRALDKAVARFEETTTDKLVKDEYLVLDEEGEPMAATSRKHGKAKKQDTRAVEVYDSDADEEYEFV